MEPEEDIVQEKASDEELINDFSNMFKKKGQIKKMPKLSSNEDNAKAPNWLLQIPAKLQIERSDLQQRKILDMRRWNSQVKSSEQSFKILASVISAWNYLYSSSGTGKDKKIFFDHIPNLFPANFLKQVEKSDEFQRFKIIEKTISILNEKTGHKAKAKVFIKPEAPQKVSDNISEDKFELLKGLVSQNKAYMYLGYNDIFNPIGYEITPLKPLDAYKKLSDIKEQNQQLWIITNGSGKYDHSFVIKRWTDIIKDLSTCWPNYFDIKKVKNGVQKRVDVTPETQNQKRGTSNCIIQIQRIQ